MKLNIIKLSTLAIAALLVVSCQKKIDDAYANPNADVRVPVEQLLPGIISSMACNSAGHGTQNDFRFIGKYIQNWQFCNSGDQYDEMGGRTINAGPDNAASIWRMHYYDIGQNNVNMIKWAMEEKKWDYAGVGKAIFAWSWLTLTDFNGEVVLKEAFNTGQLTFKYDTQEDVYNYVRQLCFESLDLLNRTGDNASQANLLKGDQYFYGGDVNKWKKFVYGMLARYHNHLSNKSIYKPDSVVYYCDKAITTNADNAYVKFAYNGGVSGSANFFGPLRGNLGSVVAGTNTGIRQSAYIANLLSGANAALPGVNDPRAWYMLRSNANNTFKGVAPNKGQTVLAANDRPKNFHGISQVAGVSNTTPANDLNCRYIFRNTSPFPIMTASEILFMRAEANYLRGQKGQALTDYLAGIGLNFDMLTTDFNVNIPAGKEITATINTKATYLASPYVTPASSSALTLSMIMMQKYISLWGHGVGETWVDMRRYHYTDKETGATTQVYVDFVPPSGTDLYPDNAGKLVYRVYPRYNSEYVWNLNEVTRIGGDKADYHTKECWFSQK